ncbi:arsenate reductase (glutaredoxin) [Marixanthomonas ophiurae]|uniref:Arsenate reductase (Glutaredoxin) n=1 Tax=Marixanthomonas ophiurae TaxID=387659 RepID=A0A3E1Q8D9_9FLAO|nr:arsenate reductase (glutaredoxin) [Marixanthomonas ophiurae]RFN58384.1 arsenate reductase (glutaredoxin) [Marixanthomonas ophiurae]
MTTIYHNPRCSKSRQTLQLLEDKKEELDIVKYLEQPPTKAELKRILELLNIKPIALVRKNEQIWKDNFKGKEVSQDEIIDAMIKNPKLIERPIVVKGNKATIGRPPENVLTIL